MNIDRDELELEILDRLNAWRLDCKHPAGIVAMDIVALFDKHRLLCDAYELGVYDTEDAIRWEIDEAIENLRFDASIGDAEGAVAKAITEAVFRVLRKRKGKQ